MEIQALRRHRAKKCGTRNHLGSGVETKKINESMAALDMSRVQSSTIGISKAIKSLITFGVKQQVQCSIFQARAVGYFNVSFSNSRAVLEPALTTVSAGILSCFLCSRFLHCAKTDFQTRKTLLKIQKKRSIGLHISIKEGLCHP